LLAGDTAREKQACASSNFETEMATINLEELIREAEREAASAAKVSVPNDLDFWATVQETYTQQLTTHAEQRRVNAKADDKYKIAYPKETRLEVRTHGFGTEWVNFLEAKHKQKVKVLIKANALPRRCIIIPFGTICLFKS